MGSTGALIYRPFRRLRTVLRRAESRKWPVANEVTLLEYWLLKDAVTFVRLILAIRMQCSVLTVLSLA